MATSNDGANARRSGKRRAGVAVSAWRSRSWNVVHTPHLSSHARSRSAISPGLKERTTKRRNLHPGPPMRSAIATA
jgi:hypothetical protein